MAVTVACIDALDGDVFDDECNITDFKIEENSWRKIEDQLVKDGYRDGLEMGEEQAVQSGHDKGFQQSLSLLQTSSLRGVVSALRCYASLQEPTESQLEFLRQVELLESDIVKLEEDWETELTKSPYSPSDLDASRRYECVPQKLVDTRHVTCIQSALLVVISELSACAHFNNEHQLSMYNSLLRNVTRLVEEMN